MKKMCTLCKQTKLLIEFPLAYSQKNGHHSFCKECFNRTNRKRRYKKKHLLVMEFGGKCIKCNFSDERALCFDHVNGGGKRERLTIVPWSDPFYVHVRKNKHLFQLLCGNCNMIKRVEMNENPKGKPHRELEEQKAIINKK